MPMGEGMLVRRGGSGGAKLRVLAVADAALLPESAKDGTIGFVSDVATGTVYALATVPTGEPAEGDVWVKLGTASSIPISMAKKGVLMLYPLAVYQYSDGLWVEKSAYVHTDGAWEALALMLYQSGDEIKNVTGGWEHRGSGTEIMYEDRVYLSVGDAARSGVVTSNAIDLTRYSTLEVTGADAPTGGTAPRSSGMVQVGILAKKTDTVKLYSQVGINKTFAQGDICTFDISGYTGEYYIFVDVVRTRRCYFNRVRLLP